VKAIAKDDPAATERFGLELIAKAESLANSPEIGISSSPHPWRPFDF
jgi:plasmid stabilization system protein ParE